jgi:hypothetical protein
MGAHPKAKDRKISIAGQDGAPQQKAATHVRFGSMLLKKSVMISASPSI